MGKDKIKFTDREDLIKQLVMRKSDVNHDGAVKGLQNALKRAKRGDKDATKQIIKLRKRMLSAASEVYIELEEEELFKTTVAEIELLEEIEE